MKTPMYAVITNPGVRPSARTDSGALRPAPRSSARKPKGIKLTKKTTVDNAIIFIFTECLKQWTANETIALRGADPEGIHEMRVGLRRMRSALSDFRAIIPAQQLAWIKRESRWLINSLGAARDWDVFLVELLAPVEAGRPLDGGLVQLRTVALTERKRGYTIARTAIRSARYSKFVAQMRQWLSAKPWRQHAPRGHQLLDKSVGKLARRVLKKRHNAALKLGRDFRELLPVERHHLRIALKKLRYSADFLRSLYPKNKAKPYFRALAQMQDCLGHMNDVVVAEHLLKRITNSREGRASVQLATAAGTLIGWHARGATAAIEETYQKWREFRSESRFW